MTCSAIGSPSSTWPTIAAGSWTASAAPSASTNCTWAGPRCCWPPTRSRTCRWPSPWSRPTTRPHAAVPQEPQDLGPGPRGRGHRRLEPLPRRAGRVVARRRPNRRRSSAFSGRAPLGPFGLGGRVRRPARVGIFASPRPIRENIALNVDGTTRSSRQGGRRIGTTAEDETLALFASRVIPIESGTRPIPGPQLINPPDGECPRRPGGLRPLSCEPRQSIP